MDEQALRLQCLGMAVDTARISRTKVDIIAKAKEYSDFVIGPPVKPVDGGVAILPNAWRPIPAAELPPSVKEAVERASAVVNGARKRKSKGKRKK